MSLTQQPGFTIWFTGLPRSGKSTIARLLVDELRRRGRQVEFLNSAKIRKELNRSLGYSQEEIETNLRRLGYECTLLNRNGLVSVVTAVSPYRAARDELRERIGRFIEVYCRAPMETLTARDDRGFFERALRGEIEHVAGINAPDEEPEKPEVLLNTDTEPPEASCKRVATTLEVLGFIDRIESACYSADEEEMIRKRLQDLGYL